MSIKVDILWRAYLVFFMVMAFGALILFQAYRVQTVRGDYWLSKADSVYLKHRSIDAERGNIYSSDNRLLATTLPTFDIRMDLKADGLTDEVFRNQIVALSQKLAQQFPYRNAKTWERKLTNARDKGERYHLVQRRVSYQTMLDMKTWPIWERGAYKGGLIIIENSTRKAPFGQLANRTIGYVKQGKEQNQIEGVGIEAYLNDYLKGNEGQRLEYRIAGGTWVPVNNEYKIEPQNGSDVITTIDVNVQDVAESSLESVLRENAAEWGCAIVMEVATGKIKAIANLTRNKNGSYTEQYNYAIAYNGEPGSTMKLVSLAALLEDGLVNISDSIDLHNGKHKIGRRTITDSEGWHPYRNVTIQKAFERSSNVGFTSLAHRYYSKNPKKFIKRLNQFHFDELYGVEIDGEKKPFYRSPGDDGWSSMSIASLAFGYELNVSPLHMLNFYNTVANNGVMMKPYLVEQIKKRGKVIVDNQPKVIDSQMLSEETVQQLQACLEGVVKEGTGKSLQSKDFSSAGKTGTTRLFVPGYNYGHFYTASFAGYFPAENPKYSCIVVVNKPTAGKYYGGSVAGPVFQSVAEMLYARSIDIQEPINHKLDSVGHYVLKGAKEDVQTIEHQLFQQSLTAKSDWLTLQQIDTIQFIKEFTQSSNKVPDVQQMGLDDAIYLLENAGLSVHVIGKGKVTSQSLAPGQIFHKGQKITIRLG